MFGSNLQFSGHPNVATRSARPASKWANWLRALIAAIIAVTLTPPTWSAPPSSGNLLVQYTYSGYQLPVVAEYRADGTFVQNVATIPKFPGVAFGMPKGIVSGPGSTIYVFYDGYDPLLAQFDIDTSTWTTRSAAGWSASVTNVGWGALARDATAVYATDTWGPPGGILRFEANGPGTSRSLKDFSPGSLAIGPDGVLYAIEAGSPRNTILMFQRNTLAYIGDISVASATYSALGVAPDGSFIVATADPSYSVKHLARDGAPIASLSLVESPISVTVDDLGRVAISTLSDLVILTNIDLASPQTFHVASGWTQPGPTFVAWVTPVSIRNASVTAVPVLNAGLIAMTATLVAGLAALAILGANPQKHR